MKKSVPASTTTPLQKRPPSFFLGNMMDTSLFLYVYCTRRHYTIWGKEEEEEEEEEGGNRCRV